jgi:hypothetical protein
MPTKKSESQKPGLEVQIDPDLRYEQAVKGARKAHLRYGIWKIFFGRNTPWHTNAAQLC